MFDRPKYRRKKIEISQTTSRSNSISKAKSLTKTISRTITLTNNIAELKPFEVLFTNLDLKHSYFLTFILITNCEFTNFLIKIKQMVFQLYNSKIDYKSVRDFHILTLIMRYIVIGWLVQRMS